MLNDLHPLVQNSLLHLYPVRMLFAFFIMEVYLNICTFLYEEFSIQYAVKKTVHLSAPSCRHDKAIDLFVTSKK